MPTTTNDLDIVPKTINPDFLKERRNATFDLAEFQEWWFGGKDKLSDKRDIEKFVFNESDKPVYFEYLSHEEIYEFGLKCATAAVKKLKQLQEIKNPGGNDIYPKLMYFYPSNGLMPANHPFATHITMFVDVIMNQGTPEQIEKFGKPALNCAIIGTYAQTELAHGTNVRGIQTRADFDRETDEFVLNTPNLSAYKFWPGGMGHTANHAMVVAQLYIDGQHKGIQMFIVPIRDAETHMPLPGVDVGEIGKKLGMHATNQGYLGLKNVRIPRTNMLMKNAKILPDGTFIESPASKLSYLTMVYTRCLCLNHNNALLLSAVTIATRYSCARRQSPINPSDPEPQILDHVAQQMKVLPDIATAMAHNYCTGLVWSMYERTKQDIAAGDYSRLQEMHIVSSVMKAVVSKESCEAIERLRLACGGHGFLTSANLGPIYGEAVASYTYEGEYTVLMLQAGRYLLKIWGDLLKGKKLPLTLSYFEEFGHSKTFPAWNGSNECLVKALQFAAAQKTRVAFEKMAERLRAGETQQEAQNHTGIDLVQAAELHCLQFLTSNWASYINGSGTKRCSKALRNMLQDVLELYLLHSFLKNLHHILIFMPLSESELRKLQDRLQDALKKVRINALAICDGFDIHDRVLNSALGSYDGNIYERIMLAAKQSPLNQKPVPKAYETILKPFFKSNL